ncbi:MAG: hypothetical protein FJ272_02640, partial [Planctomycetes bacterium]|nr:hypothetical protein [Planctomycetota bacterium]
MRAYRLFWLSALTVAFLSRMGNAQDLRSRLEGLVYEVEEWTTPTDAWHKDKSSADKWNLWTTEEDVHKKRSKGASLQSPKVEKDRATPEEGAPPLHSHITGIPNGLYHVYQSPPNRAIAVSYDGKTWTKHTGGEVYHGLLNITDGAFDLWVDDRYAYPANLGTCYYDYIRFVKAEPPKFERFAAFVLPDGQTQLSWVTDGRMPTGTVEFGVGDKLDQRVTSAETGLRNHRVVLGALDPTKEYGARVAFAVGKGALSSPVFKFRPAPPRPSKPSAPVHIPLAVAEPTQRGRAQWPVVSGLPFAQGALADAAHVQVLDGAGKPVPAHAYAQSRWPDGSVKWLAVEALVDTAPGKPTALVLAVQPGAQKAPATLAGAVKLAESPDGWLVQNGRLQFHVAKKSFALFDRVSFDANADGQFSADELMTGEPQLNNGMIQDAAGKRYGLGPPDVVRVETASALRAVIRIEGDFVSPEGQRLFRYRARITCCANQPFFKLEWTVGNNGVTDLFTPLSGAAFRLPIRADGGVEGQLNHGKFTPVRGDNDLWLLQDDDNHFSLSASGSTTAGEHAVGLATVRSGPRQITAHVRHFWQTFPKGYAVKPDGLHIRLLPALPTGLYSQHKADDVVKWSYWYRDGKYLFKRGLEYTSEVSCHFGPPSDGLAEHFEQPLFAVAPADVYCKSDAFGPVLPRAEGEFVSYEKMVDGGLERLEQNRLKKREYGWMNFGDWHGERRDNWGNSEYDLQWGLALHFARTGDLRYLWRGEEMARHTVSIDTVHYPWSPRMPGLVYVHCVGHVG